jgi:hypothetical protein
VINGMNSASVSIVSDNCIRAFSKKSFMSLYV